MCTTGAKIFRAGHEFVLFKNRDFTRDIFNDRIELTDSHFGVRGLATWDGTDPTKDVFSGYSIGFNRHLACCDSNVKTIKNGQNYDELVQAVVEHCTTVDEAIQGVQDLVHKNTYCWANMIVASVNEVAAIEVREQEIAVQRHLVYITRANHHIYLGATPDDDDTLTTAWRYETADSLLARSTSLDDIFTILQARHPQKDYGICNSGMYTTVYSYVLRWHDGAVDFYVLQGAPTSDKRYVCLPITFDEPTDLSRYPGHTLG